MPRWFNLRTSPLKERSTLTRVVLPPEIAPVGVMVEFAGSSAPDGWLLCDGSAVSRTTYADLFDEIGTTWGSGDGSTTFNVPDRRNRVGIGAGPKSLAATGGAETHTLTTAEMPAHTHPPAGAAPFVTFTGAADGGLSVDVGGTHETATGSAGGGGAHNNMQPYVVVNFIIRV